MRRGLGAAVVFLGKKLMDRLGDHRTHVVDFEQGFDRRIHDRIQRTEVLRKIFRRRFADVANP